jgi:hypothetical protein
MECQSHNYDYENRIYVQCNQQGLLRIDPFVQEIYGEDEWVVMCDYHWQERKDDI